MTIVQEIQPHLYTIAGLAIALSFVAAISLLFAQKLAPNDRRGRRRIGGGIALAGLALIGVALFVRLA